MREVRPGPGHYTGAWALQLTMRLGQLATRGLVFDNGALVGERKAPARPIGADLVLKERDLMPCWRFGRGLGTTLGTTPSSTDHALASNLRATATASSSAFHSSVQFKHSALNNG